MWLLLSFFISAQAAVVVEVVRGVDDPTSIAIVPFGWDEDVRPPQDIADIVAFDLARSGRFVPLDPADMLSYPTAPKEVFFRDWRVQGVEYLLIGTLGPGLEGRVELQYRLLDVAQEELMLTERIETTVEDLRDFAHHVSDRVYEEITGIPGAFSTRIVYVLVQNAGTPDVRFQLKLADSDGARERTLLDSNEPVLSADWSPDGRQIVFVWFDGGRPGIYLQDLGTDERVKLTGYRGLNGAPSWSPDGMRLALVLSRDGNPELYLMDLSTGRLERITRHFAIDTEPSWTADGNALIYTSDRGGKPQIYKVTLANGLVERLTFVGDYNARARMLPDGKHIVFVHRAIGVFHIALMNLESGRIRVLTETTLDESPSVAPNGDMLIYATLAEGRGILAVVSIDGQVKYRLPSAFGDVREPAWSPYLGGAVGP
ncbi:MAG: Tol-Pal system beta propeller repeat protein TolB [Pseudomonadales bacterium]